MTDQPERRDAAQERLPAPRPASTPVPAERFSAPPSAHRNDLTPERAAKVVRQSANARWVGFLAVTVVTLFVIGYYFYELGLPGGLSESRLTTQDRAQQVTSIERGYNIYQANCAQCHGVNGEGISGPTLNRQDKLFAHLDVDYLNNILTVGGRYACGNPDSIMPIWSNEGNPPGPLNYKQIEDIINYLRAEKGEAYRILDPALFEPMVDPVTKEELTFEGWVDPEYKPEPGATPYPACWADEFASPTSAPSSPGASPGASEAPSGPVVELSALNIQWEQPTLSAPADTAFTIHFNNKDQGVPHDVVIKDAGGMEMFRGELVTGPKEVDYQVPALAAGTYQFICSVHPNMIGSLTVGG